jgi:D-alanyl-D-alanine carboxypeptidase
MVRFAASARTVAGKGGELHIEQLDDLTYKISGDVQIGMGESSRRFPLADPGLYAAGVMKSLLEVAGIKVEGSVRSALGFPWGRTKPTYRKR